MMTLKKTSSISFTASGYGSEASDLVEAVRQVPTDAKNVKLDISYIDGDYGRMGQYTIELSWDS